MVAGNSDSLPSRYTKRANVQTPLAYLSSAPAAHAERLSYSLSRANAAVNGGSVECLRTRAWSVRPPPGMPTPVELEASCSMNSLP